MDKMKINILKWKYFYLHLEILDEHGIRIVQDRGKNLGKITNKLWVWHE